MQKWMFCILYELVSPHRKARARLRTGWLVFSLGLGFIISGVIYSTGSHFPSFPTVLKFGMNVPASHCHLKGGSDGTELQSYCHIHYIGVKVWDPLELKLQRVVSCHVGSRN